MSITQIKHFHVCGGSGSGAAGFKDARPELGTLKGEMVCLGGIDVDPQACADFQMLTGVRQTCRDMFSLGQYRAFHGHMPPPGWVEMLPQDVRDAAGGQFPDIIFTSMPCKGFSGLLSALKSLSAKYQALNELTLRGMWLSLEAFADDLPAFFIFENVPRIATRGRHLLDQIVALLRHYGYVVSETFHDCGELGEGMSQSRKRFLLVARLPRKIPPFLYEPPKRPLRPVSDVLGHMPLPGDPLGGPMHRIPALQWKTWVRLAFVEAGSDWRSLNRLAVEDGKLRDFLIVPELRGGALGVKRWEDTAGTVAGESLPSNGAFSVADPRFQQSTRWKDGQALGVRLWADSTGTVAGQTGPLQGAYSVADPRHHGPAKHSNEFRIVQWDRAACAVTSAHGSGQAVADPRRDGPAFAKYSVAGFGEPSNTVIAGSTTGQGAYAVADPRPGMAADRADYLTGGHYGVVPWSSSSGAVSASACHDNGRWSVADPRATSGFADTIEAPPMPAPNDKLICRIQALDGTWHRPFTTLELAALQTFIDPEEYFAPDGPAARGEAFVLAGESDQRWREGIGNAVPRRAARAIAEVMGQTILLARTGETFALGSTPIWVRPIATAISVAQEGGMA